MNLQSYLEQFRTSMVELRREFHQCPELSDEEVQTTQKIVQQLKDTNVELLDLGLSTGVLARLRGAKPGKTLLLREDIDALPVKEETNLPYCSQKEGVSHACGHDIHTAILVYVAKVLSQMQEELSGEVLFLFQPAEEVGSGAKSVLEQGKLSKYSVDCVLGLHCSPEIDAGKIGLRKGAANASTDLIRMEVVGKGGHGAHPYNTVDPIIISAYLLTQLQTVVSRENKPTYPAVLTFGKIQGGTASNVIPDRVYLEGTLRSVNEEYRNQAKESIVRMAKLVSESMRGSAKVEFAQSIPPLVNSPEVIDRVREAAVKELGEKAVEEVELPSMGSDDFALLLGEAKCGAQFRLGTGTKDSATRMGLHNAKNIFDEQAIYVGAATLCRFALDYLQ